MDAGIFFSVTYNKNIEKMIWIESKAGFSFQNWLYAILIYGVICPIGRLDPVKVTQQDTLFQWDRQASSGTVIDMGLLKEANICY